MQIMVYNKQEKEEPDNITGIDQGNAVKAVALKIISAGSFRHPGMFERTKENRKDRKDTTDEFFQV